METLPWRQPNGKAFWTNGSKGAPWKQWRRSYFGNRQQRLMLLKHLICSLRYHLIHAGDGRSAKVFAVFERAVAFRQRWKAAESRGNGSRLSDLWAQKSWGVSFLIYFFKFFTSQVETFWHFWMPIRLKEEEIIDSNHEHDLFVDFLILKDLFKLNNQSVFISWTL